MYIRYLFVASIITLSLSSMFSQNIYDVNWKKEKPLFGIGLTFFATSYVIDRSVDDITEAEINALNPDNLLSIDRHAIFNNSRTAARNSDYFRDGIFFVPVLVAGIGKGQKEWKSIAVMYAETILLNTSLTTILKTSTQRARPFIYNDGIPLEEKIVYDAKWSFYSGHVSHVSALSFFTASVFNDLYPESNYKWAVYGGAAILPAVTSYLRYASGLHFPTDLMVGYVTGGIIGYFIPKIHKIKNENLDFGLAPHFHGASLNLKLQF